MISDYLRPYTFRHKLIHSLVQTVLAFSIVNNFCDTSSVLYTCEVGPDLAVLRINRKFHYYSVLGPSNEALLTSTGCYRALKIEILPIISKSF